MKLYGSHQEDKYIIVINEDLLNEGWEMKISQEELTEQCGQFSTRAYKFVTIFLSTFLFPYTCLTRWAHINGPGLSID